MTTVLHNVWSQLCYSPEEPLMFNSGLFWVLFVAFIAVYALLKSRRTQMMLFVTAFSLFFFYKSSGFTFLLLVATALIDWYLARRMAAATSPGWRKGWLLAISLTCSIGLLAFFKYGNFLMWNFGALVGRNFHPLDLVLPVGISFYTFRTVSYVVDVYRGKLEPARNFLDYLFFLSFFPCLVAGPIVRADKFLPQLRANKPATREMIWGGLWLVMLGLLKKAVFADYIAQYNNIAFGNPAGYSGVELLMAVLGYTMQIYCDFSGYSDMAIGLGAIMGFDLGINFDYPYRSLNVTMFWRRWHISLSLWLRDYVYIGLGGNRKGRLRQLLNLMLTMLVGGLWHGASWNFIVWGAGHGAALCAHKLCMPWLKRVPDTRAVCFASWLFTFVLVSFLWIFFRAENFTVAGQVISGVFTRFNCAYFPVFFKVRWLWCTMMLVIFALHFVPVRCYDRLRQWFIGAPWVVRLLVFMAVVQLVVYFATEDVQPLIYGQF